MWNRDFFCRRCAGGVQQNRISFTSVDVVVWSLGSLVEESHGSENCTNWLVCRHRKGLSPHEQASVVSGREADLCHPPCSAAEHQCRHGYPEKDRARGWTPARTVPGPEGRAGAA